MVIVYRKKRMNDTCSEKCWLTQTWSGEVHHRRSTTRMAIMRGIQILKRSTKRWGSIDLISAEGEFYAPGHGATHGRGVRLLFAGGGISMAFTVH